MYTYVEHTCCRSNNISDSTPTIIDSDGRRYSNVVLTCIFIATKMINVSVN